MLTAPPKVLANVTLEQVKDVCKSQMNGSIQEFDSVNHPKHYTSGGIECIDAMISAYGKEAVAWFCLCNAFKYTWRTNLKNGIEDLNKAQWYINKYKELKAKKDENE